MNMTLDDLLEQCTVKIVTDSSLGTGFFVGREHILTCAHVIKKAYHDHTPIKVYWGDQCCDAVVEGIQVEEISVREMDREITYSYPDLTLLRITFPDHHCVCLKDEHISATDNVSLLSYGYIEGFPEGDPSKFQYVGESSIGASKYLLKFQGGQASRGLSGAPLLNLKTNCVCGIVQSSLDAHKPWGGRAIPTSIIFEAFPEVMKFQEEYFCRENPWLGVAPPREHFWYSPYQRNPFFTGRNDVLTRLHTELTTNASPLPQAINGLSGIGKTQIAIEYAYRYRSDYQAVFCIRVDSYQVRALDFISIARGLNLPEKNDQDQHRIEEAVQSWLQDHQNWLLILDNVKNEDITWACDFCPQGKEHHILLTTRAQIVDEDRRANSIGIEKMDREEGILLLLRCAGILKRDVPNSAIQNDQVNAAREIVKAMDGLPLALEQAAAYIKQNRCRLSDYLNLYRERRQELLLLRPKDHESVTTTTWSLSFQQVEQRCAAAADLLRFCAFLNPDAIPVDQIIAKGAPDLGSVLQPVAADYIKLNEAIDELLKFSLVRYSATTEPRTLTIHRLVQDALKDSMSEDTQRLWIERTVRALDRAFPNVEYKEWPTCQQCLPHVLTCIPLIIQKDITAVEATRLLNKAGSYLRDTAQFAQAKELFQQALVIRERMLMLEETEEATSLHNLALLYYKQGEYAQAEPYYQKALTIRKNALGLRHPDTATSLNDLAGLYYSEGKYPQAEKLCQQGRRIREKKLKLEHPDTATSFNDLGNIYYKQGKYEQAEKFYKQAQDIRWKILGPEHPDTITSYNNLARLYYSQGRYEEASPLFEKALNVRQKILGPAHPDIATSLNDLARLYYRLGKYDQAEPLYLRARLAWEKILGPEPQHPDVATVYNNLAKLYYRQGDYVKAKEFYLKALIMRQSTLGSEHPDVATTLNDLARLYYKLGIYTDAVKFHRQALAMRKRLLGPRHEDVAESLNNLASVYYKQGNYAQAEDLYQKALTIRKKVLNPEHPDVAETLDNQGRLYYRLGKYDKAKDHYQKAQIIREQVLGPEHPDTAITLNNLAKLYSKQGEYKQAEQLYDKARIIWETLLQKKPLGSGQSPDMATILNNLARLYTEKSEYNRAESLYKQALAIRMQILGPESPDTASSLSDMGWLYYKQGQYEQAEQLYKDALAIREQVLGPRHPYLAHTLNDLANLYNDRGNYSQAEDLYQKALIIRQNALGPEHPYVATTLNNLGRLHYRQGNYSSAEGLYRDALSIREKIRPEHPEVAETLNDLANLYKERGQYEQAEPLYQRALAIREQTLRSGHPDISTVLRSYADLFRKTNREAQAKELEARQ